MPPKEELKICRHCLTSLRLQKSLGYFYFVFLVFSFISFSFITFFKGHLVSGSGGPCHFQTRNHCLQSDNMDQRTATWASKTHRSGGTAALMSPSKPFVANDPWKCELLGITREQIIRTGNCAWVRMKKREIKTLKKNYATQEVAA